MVNVKGKKILVLGLGVSGEAACRLLADRGAQVRISEGFDTPEVRIRLETLKDHLVGYEIGGHTAKFCGNSKMVIASPGINVQPLCLRGIISKKAVVLGELELGFLFSPAPIIAITGTNGKSTTTRLIGSILSAGGRHAVLSGNIGNPLCGEIDRLTAESVAVVEVSSFQLETIRKFKPHIAILLNITVDHYERHGNYENYKRSKFKIFENQTEKDWAILNSTFLKDTITKNIKSRCIFHSHKNKDVIIEIDGKKEFIAHEKELFLKGTHNLDNIQSAAYASGIMGIDKRVIRQSVVTFKALAHRCEKIAVSGGIEFVDDSKATNIDASRAALEQIQGKVILIAGGRDKGGNYASILSLVKKKVKAMVLIGESAGIMDGAFKKAVPVTRVSSMREAVEKSISLAEMGDTVLLSPMCSSFDMFSGYKERGEVFSREVEKLLLSFGRRPRQTGSLKV
ncbi:MAG: UDP-N-acetylmuramoyl-L-alanine--D-glutamate ligase [Candidatus Omnitrophica bacterium]|nr:UDP-N-acetylmuramoyl-L-alanine--D-glutamate ligase [Candidatus Omnitrophota bacterium]